MSDDALAWVCATLGFIAIGVMAAQPKPTKEEIYHQRVRAYYNVPQWARGDFPERDEPRKPRKAFGLEW